jgi:hypothetical protein
MWLVYKERGIQGFFDGASLPQYILLRRLGWRCTNRSWYSRGQGTDKNTILTQTVSLSVTKSHHIRLHYHLTQQGAPLPR